MDDDMLENHPESVRPQNMVAFIQANIRLENVSMHNIDAIQKIGAHQVKLGSREVWVIDYENEKDLAAKLNELNGLGFSFVGVEPAGWFPGAVFEHLRDKKLLKGTFKELVWRGPGDWFITDK